MLLPPAAAAAMAKNGSNSISSEAAKQQNDDDDVITSRPLATLCIIDLFWCLYILPSIQTIASTYYYTNGLVGTPGKTIFSDEISTGGRKFYHHYSACKMGRGQDGRLPTKIYLPAGLGEEEGVGRRRMGRWRFFCSPRTFSQAGGYNACEDGDTAYQNQPMSACKNYVFS